MTEPARELTPFQITVAQLFFALPESDGFLLAGGAGLLAQNLTHRPTLDLDFFTRHDAGVPRARDAFEAACQQRGWSAFRIHDTATFCRLTVMADETLLVDLALDSPPQLPPVASFLGPTFAPEELAARKVLALFDRAEARDFTDVYQLSKVFNRDDLVERAGRLDLGFTPALLAEAIQSLARFTDNELPLPPSEAPRLRAFYAEWVRKINP